MRRKLDRLLRFKTQNLSQEKQSSLRHQSRISGTISIKRFDQKKQNITQRQPFAQKHPNITFTLLKTSTQKLKPNFSKRLNDNLNKSLKFDRDFKESRRKITRIGQKQMFLDILIKEVEFYKKSDQRTCDLLQNIVWICDQLIEQVYSYCKVESFIKNLNSLIKEVGSKSMIFLGYCLSTQELFIYGSYSLAIFYADKALKLLSQKETIYKYERQKQSDLYRTITKIFLIKNQFNTAKEFGYKYLRKAWLLRNFEKQVDAYDLLGKIYHEIEEKTMSIYFHNRMCKGEREDLQIIRISNYELDKAEKDRPQFAVYQTIQIFIHGDQIFNQLLEDRYRMKNRDFQIQNIDFINQFYFYTHRSPNRNLNNYRILERKMIEQKKSKELHFIKPKQKGNLKKMISQFSQLVSETKQQFISNSENFSEMERFLTETK